MPGDPPGAGRGTLGARPTSPDAGGELGDPVAGVGTRRRGRSPALEPDDERRVILSATLTVLRRSGYDRATLDEVLTEAGLSTRAFYRHYASKDELLVALYEREATAVAARLAKVVASAPGPAEAVTAWVDDVLSIRFDPRREQRAGLLRSREAQRGPLWEEIRRATSLALTQPLLGALRAGKVDGTFPDADPELDARTIHDLTFGLFQLLEDRPPRLTREDAREHVLRFVLRALGFDPKG